MRKFLHRSRGILSRGPINHKYCYYYSENRSSNMVNQLCKHFEIGESRAQYLCIKHPVINSLSEEKLTSFVNTFYEFGFSKEVIIEEPSLLSLTPITLKNRYKVLEECGITEVTAKKLANFLPIIKEQSIAELKKCGEISTVLNVEKRLAGYMTQWPTSLTTLIYSDIDECTLYSLRLKIMKRYLELMIQLKAEEFDRGIKTYPTIKHRPLQTISETLTILQSQIMIPADKIKSNLYLIQCDTENLKKIIYNFRSIGGIDVKEVIRTHPKIATKSYAHLIEIRKVLQEYNISNEAQLRCFDIFTLSPNTVRERLEKAHKIPEFQVFVNHPRFLKIIHYNNTVNERMLKLYHNNKKCLSLNVLSGSSAGYQIFEKSPGDRLGKGKDIVFCISQCLGKSYTASNIRNTLRRHPFWINIPLVQVQYVYKNLSSDFTASDIYSNCPILLYPWSKVKAILNSLNSNKFILQEQINLDLLSNAQKLSLVLYLLERNHYFSGNGVWTEEKNKNSESTSLEI